MKSRRTIFFVCLTGISALSTVVVVGFAVPPVSSSVSDSSSCHESRTILRYVAQAQYQEAQYHRSQPNDVKLIDVEVEDKTQTQSVYIPLQEMEDTVKRAQENHDQDCASMQNIIDEQREELRRLKEQHQKAGLNDRLQYDHLSENAEANWGENHEEKMQRTAERVQYLTSENENLQAELDAERDRFELEKLRLQQKLNEARDDSLEAQQILSLERSYFVTAIKLLEAGLERETNHVKALEDQLLQYNEMGFELDHDHPFHEDLPPFETWESPGAYEQRHEDHPHEFHHPPPFPEEEFEVFEEFEPHVRPQEAFDSICEPSFQVLEPMSIHGQHDSRTTNTSMRRPATAATPVMGADRKSVV